MKFSLKQIFCRHKETEPMLKGEGLFHAISGERVYYVCKRCGKIVSSYFREYEGNGYK